MKINYKIVIFVLLCVAAVVSIIMYLFSGQVAVLDPKGWVALKQRDLLVTSTLLMLIVVIPVYILTFFIMWKYRASNKDAKYSPNWDQSLLAETIWWGIPCLIVLVLSIMTWKSSHALDPFKPLVSNTKPVRIQVVALQWKWLFIYPEENIATVNFFQIPEQTPINFELTADAPMNSFWVPQLAGQIFAMPGMKTKLHFIADAEGIYRGSSANISGKGFAGMSFKVKSSSAADYASWVQSAKLNNSVLDLATYQKLAEPSEYNKVAYYTLGKEDLFEWIVMKYMMPMAPMAPMSPMK